MTAEEFFALGETQERYELIDGVVFMSPSPTPRHQKVIMLLLKQLLGWQETAPGAELLADTDVRLTSGKVYRPDVVVYAPGRLPDLPEHLVTAPDLVVEVLSPGSKPLDLITKRDDYDSFCVAEYWVVDPDEVSIRRWSRSGNRLLESGVDREQVESTALPGLRVDLAAIRKAMS